MSLRRDLELIARWVPTGAHVLDLGSGDGELLAHLQTQGCTGYGVELDDGLIKQSIERGVHVIQQDLESGLSLFGDSSFDCVLLLETLQQMRHVEDILRDVARVGKEAIISFPNFGYWNHRWQLLQGKMPVSKSLPYQWYDSPNLRCATIADFAELARSVGMQVIDHTALHDGKPVHWLPNLRGSLAIFRLKRAV